MEAVETRDLEALIGDIAARLIGNNRRRREQIVPAVLEALVLAVLERDERFVGSARGLYWELAEAQERNELDRRRREEQLAEAAREGEPAELARLQRLAIEQGLSPLSPPVKLRGEDEVWV